MIKSLSTRSRIGLLAALVAAAVAISLVVRWRAAASSLKPALFVQAQGDIDTVRYSNDGRLLMTTDANDGLVTFRDPATGQVLRQWHGEAGQTWLSTDGRRVLGTDTTPGGPPRCALRDAATGKALRQWTGQVLDVLPDLSLMVTADDAPSSRSPGAGNRPAAGRVEVVTTGRVIGRFPLSLPWGVRLSPDGHYLFLPGGNEPSRLLRLPDMTPALPALPPLTSLRVSPDGTRAFGVTRTGMLHVWLLPSGRHSAVATGLSSTLWAFSLADGTIGVEGETDAGSSRHDVLQVRSADGVRLLRTVPSGVDSLSPDRRFLAASIWGGPGQKFYDVYDLVRGTRITRLDAASDPLGQPLSWEGISADNLAAAPGGRRFACASHGGLLRLYDLARRAAPAPTARVSTDGGNTVLSFATGSGPGLFDAVALPGGGVAASGVTYASPEQRQVRVWRAGRDVLSVTADVGYSEVSNLGVSPDGRLLAGSCQSGVWTLDLARGGSGQMVTAVPSGAQRLNSGQMGRPVWLDGPGQPLTVVSTGDFGDGPVSLTRWDGSGNTTDEERVVVPAKQTLGGRSYMMARAVVSPDGRTLVVQWNQVVHQVQGGKSVDAITSDGLMELRDTRTGHLLRTLLATRFHGYYGAFPAALGRPAFSPDGRLIAVADELGRVLLWDMATGRRAGLLSGTRALNGGMTEAFASEEFGNAALLAFSPDDRFLAAARDDGSVYLYSLRTFLPVAQIGQATAETSFQTLGGGDQMPRPLRWLAFDADGRTLYGVAQNGSEVLVWDVPRVSP